MLGKKISSEIVFAKQLIQANVESSNGYLQRRAMNQFESTCFIYFSRILSSLSIPSVASMTNTIIAQDFLERQNFTSDEANSLGSLWIDSYPKEYARLIQKIDAEFKEKYDSSEARKRRNAIIQAMRDWFEGNRLIETFVQTGVHIRTEKHDSRIGRIVISEKIDLGLTHKEEINYLWIQTVLAFLYDGDMETVNKAVKILLPLAMLFQLAEDYANLKRDERVNKKTIFTSQPEAELSFAKKLQYMRKKSGIYLDKIKQGFIFTNIVRFGWILKVAVAKYRAHFSGKEWRAAKEYSIANTIENERFGI